LWLGNGFIWGFIPQGFDALEFFDRAAIEAFTLGFVAQEEWERVVLLGQAVEAVG
jgi:hypothetical protein